ncbi:peptidase s8 : Subtilase family protein OS=Lyngbya aestuarii BL J GN=M595_2213 PE=3 SV=1: Peptidase_S8 [Gemmata massiliana]|uniref:Peptidase S8/S53 domain-containing protein n=1 Tax=Gemmata massiliana TaxID=1210884 RepID=A0A6P2CYK7_9BACT|nr:S8 family peptidase [Gemmata massiliana]VTR93195.1 peptidase s8 : Subtilase family protein OS=Lyngbya aestuarii BL J GN=M595_2213 PE=3 SV=1: Peptidase_S8 [Gemmata massiliana]
MRYVYGLSSIVIFALAVSVLAPLPARVPVPPAAPPPHALLAPDQPDREWKLPPGELAPNQIVIQADAGDVVDWGHATIGVSDAWKQTKGKGATVAVLDTGYDHSHRDLKNQVTASKDFTGSRSGDSDVNGHGTHCAGIIAAEENGVGVIGVAPQAKVLAGKVLGDNGSGLSTWIAAGIDWAVENGADVISMSLGSDAPDSRIEAAVKRALAKNVIVIAAAGNSGPREGSAGWPGSFEGVVCVAAVDSNQAVASFSSRGKNVQVAAPGVNVRSCYPGDRFATMSGTSMATPYVAGCAALFVSYCKARGIKWAPADFATAIAKTSKDLPPTGRDTASGFGLVQPAKLLPADDPTVPNPPTPPDTGDGIIITPPPATPITIGGRKVKRIVLELEPK